MNPSVTGRQSPQQISLKEGDNKIELKAASELAGSLYIDNFTIDNNVEISMAGISKTYGRKEMEE